MVSHNFISILNIQRQRISHPLSIEDVRSDEVEIQRLEAMNFAQKCEFFHLLFNLQHISVLPLICSWKKQKLKITLYQSK